MDKADFDIVIVGGGMVGCALACAIAGNEHCKGLNIALLEAASESANKKANEKPESDSEKFDSRVVALSNKSREFLQTLGVWQSLSLQRHCPYKEMFVWDGEGTGSIRFDCHDIRENQLGYIVENNIVIAALRKKIAELENVQFIYNARVSDIQFEVIGERPLQEIAVSVDGDTQTIKTRLILAADGARSNVRDMAGLPTREWDYGHSAIIATIETEKSHDYTARQRFTSSGPIAFLPLLDEALSSAKSTAYCSLVWSAETDLATALMALNDEEFALKLGAAFEEKSGKVLSVGTRHCIPLRQRYAKSYIRQGLALVGDAAHSIHPLAGQGVNLGLYDALAITDEIARSQVRQFPLEDFSILQRYERERQSHNILAMAAMEGFKRLFASDQLAFRWLRNFGMQHFDQTLWLKKKLMKVASG